jgi:hypothetical protein
MRVLLIEEEERKHSNIAAFSKEHGAEAWSLPEATRPLGDTSALAAWIEQGRPVGPLP